MGISQKELAEKIGSSQNTISRWIGGANRPDTKSLEKIAAALNIPITDLLDHQVELRRKDGFVYLPIVAEVSAGYGTAHQPMQCENFIIMEEKDFRIDFHGIDPAKLVVVTIRGDSMEPTFKRNDRVLVDISDTEIHDGIYCVHLDGHEYIKRLQRIPGDKWLVKSDNTNYVPQKIDEYSSFKIHGRVVGAIMVRRV